MRVFCCAVLALFFGLPASAEPFMPIGPYTSIPKGHFYFCQAHKAECDQPSKRMIVYMSDKNWQDAININKAVNETIMPMSDKDTTGQDEEWFYPHDRGDCEDFALLKRRYLLEIGFPVGALLITVVRQESGDGHAVLTLVTGDGDYILDNLQGEILRWDATPYTYVKRQSGLSVRSWVSIEKEAVKTSAATQ